MTQQSIEGLTVPGQHGPRPTVTDAMKLKAALPIAMEMLFDDGAKDIADNGSLHSDGYTLAKALESDGWDISREDIDTLDEFSHNLSDELEQAEKQWAEINDIQPPLPIGTRITVARSGEGEITGVYQHGAAKYEVRLDSNTAAQDASNTRRIIKFEDAAAA